MTEDHERPAGDDAFDGADGDEFERLGRRAASELRLPPPDDGLALVTRAVRTRRVGTAAIGTSLAVFAIAAALVIAGRVGNDDQVPVTVPPTAADPTATEVAVPTYMELGSALVTDLDVSDDGTLVATVTEQGAVRVYDASTGATKVSVVAPNGTVLAYVAISPDSATVGALAIDGAEHYWAIADGTAADAFPTDWPDPALPRAPGGVVEGPGGDVGVRLGRFTGAELIDIASGDTLRRLGTNGTAYTAAFSADGSLVAVKFDESVRIWRLNPFAELPSVGIPAYAATGEDIEFTPDGRRIAFTVEDRVVIQEIDLIPAETSVAESTGLAET